MTVDDLLKPGILVLCGSDGGGKPTTAAALAARAAVREDMHVAVLTIDPARRLANAMGLAKLGNRLRQVNLAAAAGTTAKGRLEAGMLETKSAWDHLIIEQAGSHEKAEKILPNPFYKQTPRPSSRPPTY